MTHRIHILPEDKHFTLEGRESILDAALRAGISIDYNCSNGNCGKCRVKVLSGETSRIRHNDYVFSPEEKQQGYILGCAHSAVADLTIQAAVAHDGSDLSEQHIAAKIKKLEKVNDDLVILHVKTPRNQRLRFLAGQHVSLSLASAGPYYAAIASCPCEDMRLEFHIRRLPGDDFTAALFDRARAGQVIDVEGPSGNFVLHEPSDQPLLLIAMDTGYAAIKSLIEHALAVDENRAIHFYWLTCTDEQPYMHRLCHALEDAMDNFYYQHINLAIEDGQVSFETGAARQAVEKFFHQVLQDLPSLAGYEAYLAVPHLVTTMAADILCPHGLDTTHIQVEPLQLHREIRRLV